MASLVLVPVYGIGNEGIPYLEFILCKDVCCKAWFVSLFHARGRTVGTPRAENCPPYCMVCLRSCKRIFSFNKKFHDINFFLFWLWNLVQLGCCVTTTLQPAWMRLDDSVFSAADDIMHGFIYCTAYFSRFCCIYLFWFLFRFLWYINAWTFINILCLSMWLSLSVVLECLLDRRNLVLYRSLFNLVVVPYKPSSQPPWMSVLANL